YTNMIILDEQEVMARVMRWAESAPSVRAAILTSSRVNPEPCVDQYSDYDIEVYVDDLKRS
ncbi:MAG: aminoglycoside 6-adenylyltransferase, partial [Pseudomonadota bacterium]